MRKVLLNCDKVRLYATTFQSGGEGQGVIRTYNWIDRQKNLIMQTGRPLRIETTHPIEKGFIGIIIQSEF